MITTTLQGITEFLEYWNNKHKADKDGFVPINDYNFSALSAGIGFTLKWFISKNDFDKIAAEINYNFGEDKNRMFFTFGEDRVELEIDNRNIISEFKEEVKDIDNLFKKI